MLISSLFSLIFVIGLIFLVAYCFRKFIKKGVVGSSTMSIRDSIMIDGKRRLILISHNNYNYLIMIGGSNEILLEKYQAKEDVLIKTEKKQ